MQKRLALFVGAMAGPIFFVMLYVIGGLYSMGYRSLRENGLEQRRLYLSE